MSVEVTYDSKTMVITIKAKAELGVFSSSGKSKIVATTNGFVAVDGTNYKLSLNVIEPLK